MGVGPSGGPAGSSELKRWQGPFSLPHYHGREASHAWGIRDTGSGQGGLLRLKAEAKKKTKNGFRLTTSWFKRDSLIFPVLWSPGQVWLTHMGTQGVLPRSRKGWKWTVSQAGSSLENCMSSNPFYILEYCTKSIRRLFLKFNWNYLKYGIEEVSFNMFIINEYLEHNSSC